MPLLGLWLDDVFSFITGATTRKGKNLAGNPHSVLTFSSTMLPTIDVAVEGLTEPVRDVATLQRVVEAYARTMD